MLANFQRLRAERLRGERGFTLVELLVVIVIIGILVAIAIPVFLSQRASAQERAVESDVRNAVMVLETYYAENQNYTGAAGTYTGAASPHALDEDGDILLTVSPEVTLVVTVGTPPQTYVITGAHSALGTDPVTTYDSTGGFEAEDED